MSYEITALEEGLGYEVFVPEAILG